MISYPRFSRAATARSSPRLPRSLGGRPRRRKRSVSDRSHTSGGGSAQGQPDRSEAPAVDGTRPEGAQRLAVLGGAVAHVALEAVAGVATGAGDHIAVPGNFCADGRGSHAEAGPIGVIHRPVYAVVFGVLGL